MSVGKDPKPADPQPALKLSQQLVMTPQLQLAIRLLQLGRVELDAEIRRQAAENPALALAEPAAPLVYPGAPEAPDVRVVETGGVLTVELVTSGLARLSLREAGTPEQVAAARWMVRALEQRETTLRKFSEAVVARQREFFLGRSTEPLPLSIREIAEDIGMHESTVARLASGKSIAGALRSDPFQFFFRGK